MVDWDSARIVAKKSDWKTNGIKEESPEHMMIHGWYTL